MRIVFLVSFLSLLCFNSACFSEQEMSKKEIFRWNSPACVYIARVDSEGKPAVFGSGFIITPSGIIITNYHVIEPTRFSKDRPGEKVLFPDARLIVKLPNGDIYDKVWVMAYDSRLDFAVIYIKATGLPTVKLGDSNKVDVADEVVAIGNPKGLENTFSVGVVSSIRMLEERGHRYIQHQVPISGGSSGGPLFNLQGEVIGINTFEVIGGQNLNLSLPINAVKAYLYDPPQLSYEEFVQQQIHIAGENVRSQPAPAPSQSSPPPKPTPSPEPTQKKDTHIWGKHLIKFNVIRAENVPMLKPDGSPWRGGTIFTGSAAPPCPFIRIMVKEEDRKTKRVCAASPTKTATTEWNESLSFTLDPTYDEITLKMMNRHDRFLFFQAIEDDEMGTVTIPQRTLQEGRQTLQLSTGVILIIDVNVEQKIEPEK